VPAAKRVTVGGKFARLRSVAAVFPPVVYKIIGTGVLAAVACLHWMKLGVKVVVRCVEPVGFLVRFNNFITELATDWPKLIPSLFYDDVLNCSTVVPTHLLLP
jgi:hypothetical protein